MSTVRALPAQCATALKEWALVVAALARGEQLILIRKGGLIEPGSGFEVQSDTFVLYPTFEHQTVQFMRAPFQSSFDEVLARRAPKGHLDVTLAAQVVSTAHTTDYEALTRLEPFHLYNDAFLSQRLKWQPTQPLVIVLVRVFALASPCRLPLLPQYVGCRSWVELASAVPLEGARPVLDDAVFERRARELAGLLSDDRPQH